MTQEVISEFVRDIINRNPSFHSIGTLMLHHVFLNYSHHDAETMQCVLAYLKNAGISG